MSNIEKAANIRFRIAELEDEIECLEHDEEMFDDVSIEIDDAMCQLADLRDELKELEQ